MPRIELQEPLTVPAVTARNAATAIMKEISEKRGDWSDFTLYLDLGTLGFPDVGYVAIPATISNVSVDEEPQFRIRFKMQSERMPDAFPVFDGAVGIDSNGPSSAVLWLGGDYAVPGGRFGAAFDRVVAPGVSEKTLRNMARELAGGIDARVNQTELARARYRVVFGAGD